MFKVIGEYRGKQEVLDETDSSVEAEYLEAEYKLAFGDRWAIWVREYV